jgi:adenine-specific DNA-methyltransferase
VNRKDALLPDEAPLLSPNFRVTSVLECGRERPANLTIEGDNLDALKALNISHAGLVDLIYIDPPYNTGATTRKYQDSFRDWDQFMRQRLEAARPLLSEMGVVVIAIDDAELANLRLLCDGIFGRQNYLTTLIWQGGIKNNARFSGGGVDYMLVYGNSKSALITADVRWREPKPGAGDILAAGAGAWELSGADPAAATETLRAWWRNREHDYAPGMHEYSRVDEYGRVYRIGYLGMPGDSEARRYKVFHPITALPVRMPAGEWVCTEETLYQWISEGRVIFGPDEKSLPSRKLFLDELSEQAPLPTFSQRRDYGTKHLEVILGEHRFSNPKDHRVLARWFKMMAPNDALVLDFFAGSGTTAEAVLELNQSDGGTRRFILITNNELSARETTAKRKAGHEPGSPAWEAAGVFQNVTKPRVETIITGLRPDGSRFSNGFPENVIFLRSIQAAPRTSKS